MQDEDKTRGQLLTELEELRKRFAQLEQDSAPCNGAGKALQKSEDRVSMPASASFEGIACAVNCRCADPDEQLADLSDYKLSKVFSPMDSLMIAPENLQQVIENIRSGKYGEIYRVTDISEDIAQRKHMEELELRVHERTRELEEANDRLLQIRSQLIDAQEEERKRVASELHDSVGQTLAALKFRMEFIIDMLRRGQRERAIKLIEEVVPVIQRSIDDTRSIYMELRPNVLEDFGVIAALYWYRGELLNLYPAIHIEIEVSVPESEVPEELVTPIFRIGQEALNNAARHSQSEWIDVKLIKNGTQIELVVSDDGDGMDRDQILESGTRGSPGLNGMRERAELTGGKLLIEAIQGKGTTVIARWSA
jgi:signal transduction histidine kinase